MSHRRLMRERILGGYVKYNLNRIGLRNSSKNNYLNGDSNEYLLHINGFFLMIWG
jgi:hypothetical protein